jgi:hypothetical protein
MSTTERLPFFLDVPRFTHAACTPMAFRFHAPPANGCWTLDRFQAAWSLHPTPSFDSLRLLFREIRPRSSDVPVPKPVEDRSLP